MPALGGVLYVHSISGIHTLSGKHSFYIVLLLDSAFQRFALFWYHTIFSSLL